MLSFKFGADGSEYSKGLDKMRKDTKEWAGSVKGMIGGAIGVTAIVTGFQKITESAKEINKQALLFQTTTKSVQQLGGAAERAGFTFEDLADGMHDMTEKAQDAENGNKTYAEAFAMMGIEARDFLALEGDFEGMLKLTADGLAHASEKGLDFLAANELMGGSAQKVLGTLRDGGKAFFDYADGVAVMSDANIKAALKAEDAWLKIKNNAAGAADNLGESVSKSLPFIDQAAKIGDAFLKIFPSKGNLEAKGDPIKEFFSTLTGSFSNARKQAEADALAIEAAIAKTKPQTSNDGMFEETPFERSTRKEKEAKQAVKDAEDNEKKKTAATKAAADEKKRLDKEASDVAKAKLAAEENLQKMREAIAETQKQNALDQMGLEEKQKALTSDKMKLEAEFAELVKEAQALGDNGDEKEKLKLQERALELKKELLGITRDINNVEESISEKEKRDAARTKRDADDLKTREAEIDESNALAKMTDQEKLDYLKKKQQGLLGGTDEERIEGKGMQQEIDNLAEGIASDAASKEEDAANKAMNDKKALLEGEKIDGGSSNLITSALQSIGGGGGFSMLGDPQLDEVKKTNNKLDTLIANTTPAGGSKEAEI